jgi:predicted permease
MRSIWRRKPRDFAEEIRSHVDLDRDQLIAEGANPEEAHFAALRRFGSLTLAQERFYESHRWLWLDHVLQDIRYSLRSLRKYPSTCVVAILSLAGGIGSTTATLAIRDTIFRNPPPLYQHPEELSVIYTVTPRGFRRGVPAGLLGLWATAPDGDQRWAAARGTRRDDVRTGERVDTVPVRAVTPNLFAVLGVGAALGRTFEALPPGESASVILSYRVWQNLFEGRSDAIGQILWVADRPYTVIGVMPERFWFLDIDAFVWTAVDAHNLAPDDSLAVVVRRPRNVSPAALHTALASGVADYVRTLPQSDRALRAEVESIGGTPMSRQVSLLFPYLLAGCVMLTWLIACANVAVLLIAQWTARECEIAFRAALGASRGRVVRLLFTESVLVAIGGGALGVCATFALRGLIRHNAGPYIALFDTSIHPSVLWQSSVITLLTGLLAGLAPALYETRRLQVTPLRTRRSDRVRQRSSQILVIAEINATVALLVVTGAMIDGYRRNMTADVGFPTKSLVLLRVENPRGVRPESVLEFLSGVPGVLNAAAATAAPFMSVAGLRPVALDAGGTNAVPAEQSQVSPTFFATLGVPILGGRAFAHEDTTTAAGFAIVNQSLASRLTPGRNPVGTHIWLGQTGYEVVGVVADYLPFPLSHVTPAVYLPLRPDRGVPSLQFVLRVPTAPAPLMANVRRDIQRSGTGNTVASAFAADEIIRIGSQELLVGTYPLVPLITIGIVLTAAGIYAVLAFSVVRRSREFALRVAIGASRRDVIGLVTAQSLRLIVLGSTLGVAATFGLSRIVRAVGGAGSMFDTPAWPAFAVPVLIIVGVGALATWIPARRALRFEPAALLRVE